MKKGSEERSGKGLWQAFRRALHSIYLFRKAERQPYSVTTITTDAGAREKMFIVMLRCWEGHDIPLLLTYDENRSRALAARVQADIDRLPIQEFERRWLSPPWPSTRTPEPWKDKPTEEQSKPDG